MGYSKITKQDLKSVDLFYGHQLGKLLHKVQIFKVRKDAF